MAYSVLFLLVFFFNDTATTEIYTLSLHDALPISDLHRVVLDPAGTGKECRSPVVDRKSTRLNSSHLAISYAVFCLKKNNRYSLYEQASLFINSVRFLRVVCALE